MHRHELGIFILSGIALAAALFWQPAFPGLLTLLVQPTESGFSQLAMEHAALQGRVAVLEELLRVSPEDETRGVRASVYARIPFNLNNAFLVNAGERNGVSVGDVAFTARDDAGDQSIRTSVVVGKVAQVRNTYAVIQTPFDPDWRAAVRIGTKGEDALLVGGNEPRATLIQKTAQVSPGDVVFSASPDMPYGAVFGVVRDVVLSRDGLFQEASILLSYRADALHAIVLYPHETPTDQK